jgi:hypothetical protein
MDSPACLPAYLPWHLPRQPQMKPIFDEALMATLEQLEFCFDLRADRRRRRKGL